MSASSTSEPTATNNLPTDSSRPGPEFEYRESFDKDTSYKPDPTKSLPLSATRQSLIDDIIALYSCEATVQRVKRYTPNAVYDDPFSYADNRYKIAGQWFGLKKLFKSGHTNSYQIIRNDRDLIQFKASNSWTFPGPDLLPKTTTLESMISLSLDPDSIDKDFIMVKYHKDLAKSEDYEHEGFGHFLKKFQADKTAGALSGVKEMQEFEGDKGFGGEGRK